jgi:hypothetical protein
MTNEDASDEIGIGMKTFVKFTFPVESDVAQTDEMPSKKMQTSATTPSPFADITDP